MEVGKYYLFSFALFCFQILGYNVGSLALLIVSLFPILSMDIFLKRIRTVPIYLYFLCFSLIIGLYFGLAKGVVGWTVPYWGQFYFFSFVLLAVKDKSLALTALKYCVFAIFAADLFTNLLLLIGIDAPWAVKPVLRAGETMARYTGIKGNTLYSGSISFIALCFLLQEVFKQKGLKSLLLVAVIFNIILSGSYRYFIISAAVLLLYYFHLNRHRILLYGMYVGSIVIVYIATLLTMFFSKSNFMRFIIWEHFIGEISNAPFFGHGFLNMQLDNMENFNYQHLIANGVTESCMLQLAYSFGIPVFTLFLLAIAITLYRYHLYTSFRTELALFLGLSLDLFWGGSFDNALSLSVLTLSFYLINEKIEERRIVNG